jgi:hypothetical protein
MHPLQLSILIVCGVAFILGTVFGTLAFVGRRRAERFKAQYGPRIRHATGCGLVSGANRVPGVLALLDNCIAWVAVITDQKGEIPLAGIENFVLEEARVSRFKRARKYRKACALSLVSPGHNAPVFVVSEDDAEPWRRKLVTVAMIRDGSRAQGQTP